MKMLRYLVVPGYYLTIQSSYAPHVVIVCKKSGKVKLCVDCCKLNSIIVRDAFPLMLCKAVLYYITCVV